MIMQSLSHGVARRRNQCFVSSAAGNSLEPQGHELHNEPPKLKTESNARCVNCRMTKLANKSQKRWDYRRFNAKIVIDIVAAEIGVK